MTYRGFFMSGLSADGEMSEPGAEAKVPPAAEAALPDGRKPGHSGQFLQEPTVRQLRRAGIALQMGSP
jgi:hypothetical protein